MRRLFAPRALYLGLFERFALAAAVGYGYQLGASYEAAGLLTTDSAGNGAFLGFGAQGEARSLGRAPMVSWWAYTALGLLQQLGPTRVELAVLPSLGQLESARSRVYLPDPFWLRERLRASWWQVELQLEVGQQLREDLAAGYWRGSLCSSAGSPRLLLCTGALLLEQTSRRAQVSEVSFTVGFGGRFAQTTEISTPSLRLRHF
jgi:hypothetical protein